MTNNKNLKILSPSEAREKGKIGGIKSGEKRREKAKLREELLILLDTKSDNQTMREKITLALIQKALKGDVRAYEVIRDTIGEKPAEKFEQIEPPTIIVKGIKI